MGTNVFPLLRRRAALKEGCPLSIIPQRRVVVVCQRSKARQSRIQANDLESVFELNCPLEDRSRRPCNRCHRHSIVRTVLLDTALRLIFALLAFGQFSPAGAVWMIRLAVDTRRQLRNGAVEEGSVREAPDNTNIRKLLLNHTHSSIGHFPGVAAAINDKRPEIQILAGKVLAYLDSPGAQRAIAAMALTGGNSLEVRVAAFGLLATSAKLNANMLVELMIDGIYALINSEQTDPGLRSAAAAAYGALNLPSQKVKDLILDQAKK